MKQFKKPISVLLAVVILITVAVVTPIHASKVEPASTAGGPPNFFFYPGIVTDESVDWYVWTWWFDEEFEDGHWVKGVKKDDAIFFNEVDPCIVIAAVSKDADADWDNVLYRSDGELWLDWDTAYTASEWTNDEETVFSVSGEYRETVINPTEDPTEAPTEEISEMDEFEFESHNSFEILNPAAEGTYYVNEEIEVQVGIAAYFYSYSGNGSPLNTPNSVVLEFSRDGIFIHNSVIHFYAADIGYYLTDEFTPTKAGEYKVRVGYSKSSINSLDSSNYVGTYTFEVLPDQSSTEPPTEEETDVSTEPVTEEPSKSETEPPTEEVTNVSTEPVTEVSTEPETEEPTEAGPSETISNLVFTIRNPVASGDYTADETIEIQVYLNAFLYYWQGNRLINTPNCIVLEISKDDEVVYSEVFRWYSGSLGSITTDEFTPAEAGVYTVRVGYQNYNINSMDDAIDQGSYCFTVKPYTMLMRGDADNDNSVTIFDATAIQRHLAQLPVEDFNENAADADEDNEVTIFDATSVQRHLAQLPANENIGKPFKIK